MRKYLELDYLKGLDLDDPLTTGLRRRAIRENRFLTEIYRRWYELISVSIPRGKGGVVEFGSGAGFLDEYIPGLITSEIFILKGMKIVLDGQRTPFQHRSLKAIVMTNVLHHIPSPRDFFSEASRTIRPGGVISMIEPWSSAWSKLIYTRLHHEPFDTTARSWEFPSSGPLSGAHAAMPWIIFHRDRSQFEKEFPGWRVESITLLMPFAYLLSGGVSLRPLMFAWAYLPTYWLEKLLTPFMPHLAMFAHILLKREQDE